jgi:glycosyltransferase involved in cell wall biosynthesis
MPNINKKWDGNPIYFLNPHGHHAFFTVLAISTVKPVHVLCPPLALQLLQDLWRDDKLSLAKLNIQETLAYMIAMLAFISYKAKFFTESVYLKAFRRASLIFLASKKPRTIVYYQDYLYPLLSAPCSNEFRICELIIDTTPDHPNWLSTLAAVKSANYIVAPNHKMTTEWATCGIPTHLAPYGGDKRQYLTHAKEVCAPSFASSLDTPIKNQSLIRIAARASSYRKGADLLLSALLRLDEMLSTCIVPRECRIEILICGTFDDLRLVARAEQVQDALSARGRISLSAKQYSQLEYLEVLETSDCFLMPSRLESSSLAALEALWHGIPSILSKNCGIDLFCSNQHGLLLNSLSCEAVADALYTIWAHPEKLLEWRSSLIQDRHLFSWEGYCNAYHHLLDSNMTSQPSHHLA